MGCHPALLQAEAWSLIYGWALPRIALRHSRPNESHFPSSTLCLADAGRGQGERKTLNRLTHVRGDIAICSTLTWDVSLAQRSGTARVPQIAICSTLTWDVSGFSQGGAILARSKLQEFVGGPLPHGLVLCVVEICDCLPVEKCGVTPNEHEWYFGDYSAGRFAWLTLQLPTPETPVPVKGHQGWFNLPPDVERKVIAQL